MNLYQKFLYKPDFLISQSHFGLIALLSMTYANVLKDSGKKFVNYKRAIDPYSYPVPAISFNEIPGQSKVTGQTSKPISSSQFGSSGGEYNPVKTTFVLVRHGPPLWSTCCVNDEDRDKGIISLRCESG